MPSLIQARERVFIIHIVTTDRLGETAAKNHADPVLGGFPEFGGPSRREPQREREREREREFASV